MDLSCIISSGDLELYVLGQLPPDEAYKVEQLAKLFPEVEAELDAISAALEGVADAAAVPPPPSVKEGLMGKLAALKAEEEGRQAPATAAPIPTLPSSDGRSTAPVVPMRRQRTPLLAAALIGLLLCVGGLIYLASLNRQTNTRLAGVNQQLDSLQRNNTAQQQQLQTYQQTMAMLHSDEYRKIRLIQVPGKPAAEVELLWNTRTSEVYAMDLSLPQAPSDKQYQLWAIVDGKPVDAGMLTDTKMQAQKMKAFTKADAFAITLEQKGGSPTPTLEAMYVMGKTS